MSIKPIPTGRAEASINPRRTLSQTNQIRASSARECWTHYLRRRNSIECFYVEGRCLQRWKIRRFCFSIALLRRGPFGRAIATPSSRLELFSFAVLNLSLCRVQLILEWWKTLRKIKTVGTVNWILMNSIPQSVLFTSLHKFQARIDEDNEDKVTSKFRLNWS